MPEDKRHDRKCSDCGSGYKVYATCAAPHKPRCPTCRHRAAKAAENYEGMGWPTFKYRIVRVKRKATRYVREANR